jgi:hypothetical protein
MVFNLSFWSSESFLETQTSFLSKLLFTYFYKMIQGKKCAIIEMFQFFQLITAIENVLETLAKFS